VQGLEIAKIRKRICSRESQQEQQKNKTKQSKSTMVQQKFKANYPKVFCVEIPKMKNGRIVTDKNGKLQFTVECEYTCYHIAHHESWKRYLFKKNQEVIEQLAEYIEGTPEQKSKKKKRKKSKNVS